MKKKTINHHLMGD